MLLVDGSVPKFIGHGLHKLKIITCFPRTRNKGVIPLSLSGFQSQAVKNCHSLHRIVVLQGSASCGRNNSSRQKDVLKKWHLVYKFQETT